MSAIYRNLRAVLLAGGVGGARMARGLAAVLPEGNLTVVVNVGDDDTMYGVLVCADLDTVTYTLAGIEGPHGWGIAGDSHVVMDHLADLGVDTTFRLGDRDLAHCLARTSYIAGGGRLSEFTRSAAAHLGVGCSVLPASDDSIRTKIITDTDEVLDFQHYFVVRGQRDTVAGLEYRGADTAVPAPGVLEAIDDADLIIIAPSNPPLSIWPMLAMPDLVAAVTAHPTVMAVSPLIGGKAVKGPLVAVMEGLGLETSNRGIADAYQGLLSHLIVHQTDGDSAREESAIRVVATNTLIGDNAAAGRLASTLLELAGGHQPPRRR